MSIVNRAQILIVEDQIVEAMHTSSFIKNFGMDVVGISSDIDSILNMLKKVKVDLVLMDINLGSGKSGVDVARAIVDAYDIPIVFTTSYSDDETIAKALAISPYGYLMKPYSEISLQTTIQIALKRKRIEHELASSNKRFAMASKVAKLGVLEVDSSSRSVVVKSVDNLFSFPKSLSLDSFTALFPDEKIDSLKQAIANKTDFLSVLQLELDGRETQWYQVVLSDVTLANNQVQIGAIQDISVLQNTQSNLGIANKIVSEIQEGVLVCDEKGKIIKANNAFCEMMDKPLLDIISAPFDSVFPRARKEDPPIDYLKDGLRTDITVVSEKGERRHLVMSVSSFSTTSENQYYVAIFTDVTDLKLSENQLKYLAFTDALTGVGNRNYLNRVVESFKESNDVCTVIFIDLDEFKLINDTHGHEVGDEILRVCASRFKSVLRESDSVIRFGGDEFVVVTRTTCRTELHRMTSRINTVFQRAFKTTSGDFQISASIGVASASGSITTTDLLKNADIAMYSAKQFGKNNTVMFNDGLTKDIEYRLFIQQGLGSAIAEKDIVAHFQPIIGACGNILAVEALARWYLADGNIVRPDKFIPIAERSKYIHELGLLMLEEACEAIKKLTRCGFGDVLVNLNMSAAQLQNDLVLGVFEERIRAHNVNAGRIVLEITESTLQSAKARQTIKRLKSLGIKVSIDDFGTGYSCVSELAEDTYDAIKIDRSLLPNFPLDGDGNHRRALIIENVVDMCSQLELPCTLEGLETDEQVAFAKNIGATAMQGYFFARPMKLSDLMEYLQTDYAVPVLNINK